LIFQSLNALVKAIEFVVFFVKLAIGKTATLLKRLPLLQQLTQFSAQLRFLVFSGMPCPPFTVCHVFTLL
jgi:hypothetical protein